MNQSKRTPGKGVFRKVGVSALLLTALAASLLLYTTVIAAELPTQAAITKDEVNAAQQAWCDALVKIGKVHQEGGRL